MINVDIYTLRRRSLFEDFERKFCSKKIVVKKNVKERIIANEYNINTINFGFK